MSVEVHQFSCLDDNYGFLIRGGRLEEYELDFRLPSLPNFGVDLDITSSKISVS